MVLFGGCEGTEYAQPCRICFAVRQSLVCVVSLHLGPPIAFQNIEELSALVCIQIRKGARGVGVHVEIHRGLRRLIMSCSLKLRASWSPDRCIYPSIGSSRISIHTFVLPNSVWFGTYPSSPVKN